MVKKTHLSRKTKSIRILAFVLPALLIHAFVVLYPSVSTLFMSLFEWTGIGSAKFVGLRNFRDILLKDPVFWLSLLNVLKYMAYSLIVPIFMGVIAAFFIYNIRKGQSFYKILFFIPVIISSVVTGQLWGWLFNPIMGMGPVFEKLGLKFLARSWLGDPSISLYAVAFSQNWHWWGFVMIYFLAAFYEVDPACYEAAHIAGARRFQQLWYITLPLIRPAFVFIVLMTTIWSLSAFDFVWIMTQGGPGNSTELLATWIYKKAFTTWETGYACALSAILVVLSLSFIVGYVYMRKKGWDIA